MDVRVAGQVREAAEAVGSGSSDWSALVNAWRDATGADATTLLAWDNCSGELWGRSSAGFGDPDALRSYGEHFQHLDPLVPLGRQSQAGTWLDSAKLTAGAWRRGAFYAEMLRRQRIEQSIALVLCSDDRYLVSLSMHFSREHDASALKAESSQLLTDLIGVHHRRIRHIQAERERVDDLICSEAEGWLLIDTGMRVRHACPATAQLLSDDAALQVQDGQIHPRHAALASRLAIAVARVRADGLPQTVHCAARWGRVLRLRLTRPPRHLLAFGEPLLVLRVQLLDAARLPDIDALRTVYSLSAAEARLVRELVAGHSLDDCAFLFAVSRNTLRNQLASVFRKMDCARQSEVVRLAALLS